ncbi:hypothetical protein KFE25_009525 [Diacronema lutheri]|uniref:Proteasome assembly chaperone 3 n=1 Tax=Diacronema lutheri TaxID=2081491 RepID=A0A8J5XUZ0_DIALT|nr:hypothetical protein KFE25_009525 [Diacronema lutheri]
MADRVPPIESHRLTVNGVLTHVVHISYSNRVFMLISQTGKMGTVMHVQAPSDMGEGGGGVSVEAQTLIGQRSDDALDVYARRVYEAVCAKARLPLMLSLALSDLSPANLAALLAELQRALQEPCRSAQ